MLESFLTTRSGPGTQIFCYVDHADPQADDYKKMFAQLGASETALERAALGTDMAAIQYALGPRLTMPEVINLGAFHFDADYYGDVNDDHIYHTPQWDAKLAEAIEAQGGTGLAYGRTENLPGTPLISANCIRALGWFYPPAFRHQFGDNALRMLYGELGWHFCVPDVWIEHLHPDFGKAAMDPTYAIMRGHWDHDSVAFNHWVANGKATDLERLRRAK